MTVNSSTRKVNVTVPTKTSELTNDSGFKTTDNNTTYSLSKSGSTITLTGSDGSTTSVTDSNTNTFATVSTTGTGNAVTSLSTTNNFIVATKGKTFLTEHPTISKSTDTTSTETPANGETFTVIDDVTRDGNGHVTKVNTKTVTLPSSNVYTHPTTSGNKHIPSGGSSGQILRWGSDGTAVWGTDNNIDTKNTAGSTNSTSKLYLIGATSQASNPQTYSRSGTYVDSDGTFVCPKASFGGHLVDIGNNGIVVDGEITAYSFYPPDKSYTTSLGLGSSTSFDEGYIDKIYSKHLNFIYFSDFTDLSQKLTSLPQGNSCDYGKRKQPIYYPICTKPGNAQSRVNIGVLNANTSADIHYCGIILDFCFSPAIFAEGYSGTAFISMENTIIRNLHIDYKDVTDALPTSSVTHKKIYLSGQLWANSTSCGLENCIIYMQVYHSNNITSSVPYHKGIEIVGAAKIDNCYIWISGLTSTMKYHTYYFGVEATRQYPLIITNTTIHNTSGSAASGSGGTVIGGAVNIKAHANNAPLIYQNNLVTGRSSGYISTSTASGASSTGTLNADYRIV